MCAWPDMNFSIVSFRALSDLPTTQFLIVNVLAVFLHSSFGVWGPSFLLALAFCVFSLFYFYFLLACLSVSQYYWCSQESGWCFWLFSFCVFMAHVCLCMMFTCVCLFACVGMCVFKCTFTHVHMLVEAWSWHRASSSLLFTLFTEADAIWGNQRALECNGGFLASGEQRFGS